MRAYVFDANLRRSPVGETVNVVKVTKVRQIWAITLLLFVVIGQNSERLAVFAPSPSSKGERFRGRTRLAGCFSLQKTAKTATAPLVSQWAPPQAVTVN
jgi:hypothetical protein